ncbi:LacI family DNA-binding transcriptional regulator [Mesobacillus subterraneus]|uniref:LacI family DNA-binding transcriptional regulator n=1 Tax=Mesobacillus subterraneus TaxID=285983 RepID=UPI001CFCC16D|nr:LacI family DNA-binding transcriptional regulator [Mesobacillus subterraneus]WLR57356.1 LacI family DNA-binding transcriptional regulator [Mesobacillus subterraneus]
MKLTIREIAKMAGVSPATVSKIMNNYQGISSTTRDKVMNVIQSTGYQPTFSAKSLATKKSNLIGLIYAGNVSVDLNNPFFNEIINSFKKTVGSMGYDILIFSNEHFNKELGDYLSRARHYQVDGCLIISGEEIESVVYELDQSEIPCVGVDIELKGPHSSYVLTDNYKVSANVVEYLYLNSIREIAYIGGFQGNLVADIRKDGFIKTMNQFSLPIIEDWVQFGDFYEKSGYEAMKKILAKKPYPKAVFAASDMMALGAMEAIREHGLHIGDDIRVIGCDDIEACRYSDPKLSTVKQDKEKLGKLAAYLLLDIINGNPESKKVLVDPELIIRQS